MSTVVARHETAITRTELSRPLKLALADGLIAEGGTLFDYGCGLGGDLRLLSSMGIPAAGWDPYHRADAPLRPSAVVNLGYVVNVIESPNERQEALCRAWDLTDRLLIVSARLANDARFLGAAQAYNDGLLTSRGTFQKFFDHLELRNWIDQTLGVTSVSASPGVFYVFRDEQERIAFVASQYRRRVAAPRLTRSAQLYSEHEQLLRPLLDFVTDRGRLPADDELAETSAVRGALGSIRRAFQVIEHVTGSEPWAEIAALRAQDLSIYLALARFQHRPPFSRLPRPLQGDVKAFFSTYNEACRVADELLFSIGQPGVLDAACQAASVGKLTPAALYAHESVIDGLSPTLRLFEGCARNYVGRIEGANLVKLHRFEPKVSYLSYPRFEADPHPALAFSVTVHLQTFRERYSDFREAANPPILHRKEAFLSQDHPSHSKFARLTRIEEQKGLYADTSRIGTLLGWNETLVAKGLYLKGYRLLRLNDASCLRRSTRRVHSCPH
jgi:DNA phosphorothioation-associated putative methyltransferase